MVAAVAHFLFRCIEAIEHAKASVLRWLLRLDRYFYPLMAVLALLLMCADALHFHLLNEVENDSYDFVVKHWFDPAPSRQVAVVEIDACSLAWMQGTQGNSWPWSRGQYADLLMSLHDAGASAIGFDILMLDRGEDAQGDQALRQVAAALGNVSFAFAVTDWDPPLNTGVRVDRIGSVLAPNARGVTPPRLGLSLPAFPELRTHAGTVNFTRDEDGPARDVSLWREVRGWAVPSLPAIVWSRVRDRPFTELPADMRVHWRRGALPTFSAADLLDSAHPCRSLSAHAAADFLTGHAVVVGYAASGVNDMKLLPSGELVPGVQLQAQVLDGVLRGGGITVFPAWVKYLLLALAFPMIAYAFWSKPPSAAVDEGLHLLHLVLPVLAAGVMLSLHVYPDIFSALFASVIFFGLLRAYAVAWRRQRMGNHALNGAHGSHPDACLVLFKLPEGDRAVQARALHHLLTAWDALPRDPRRSLVDQWFEVAAVQTLSHACNRHPLGLWTGQLPDLEKHVDCQISHLRNAMPAGCELHATRRTLPQADHAALMRGLGELLARPSRNVKPKEKANAACPTE